LLVNPGANLDADDLAVHDLLDLLDDAMFAAIDGDGRSIAEASELWARAIAALPPELLDESRQQYLRCATETASDLTDERSRDPLRSNVALEVVALLGR
jgi:hypothetical protein